MSQRVLGLQAVSDGYTYFSCPGTQYVTIQVFNNGVDVGYGQGVGASAGAATYPPQDEYLALQTAAYPRRCDEIRFKNHVAGQTAQIQITTQGGEDLPPAHPLGVSVSPNFLTVNPDGTVTPTFSGDLILTGGQTGAFAPKSSIKWTAGPGGALLADITQFQSIGGDENLVIENIVPAGSGVNGLIRLITRDGLNAASAELDINSKTGSDATAITGSVSSAVGNRGFTLMEADGDSSFVQSRVQGSGLLPVEQRLSFTAQASGWTGAPVAGWQQAPTQSRDYDPDGLLAFNGTGYYLLAPQTGYYETVYELYITNGVGGNLDWVVGFDANGTFFVVERVISINTANAAQQAAFTWSLSAGQFITPAAWFSVVGGFGISILQSYFHCRRVA